MTQRQRRSGGKILGRRTIKKVRRYLLWDCSSCGTTGINANTCKQCFACGNPKELGDLREAEYRSSTKVNDNYRHKGADISCQSCGTENKHRFSCRNCGAALDAKFAKQVKCFSATTDQAWRNLRVEIGTDGPLRADEWDTSPVVLPEPSRPIRPSVKTQVRTTARNTARTVASLKQPEVRKDPKTRFAIVGVVLILTLIVLIGIWIYNKYNSFSGVTVEVTSVSWSYSLPLEDYDLRDKEHGTTDLSWEPPIGAENTSMTYEVIDVEYVTKQVWVEDTCTRIEDDSYNDNDGTWVEVKTEVIYDCSGYQDKQVEQDVWGNRWAYQVYEWQSIDPLTASGSDHTVEFPQFTPTSTLRVSGSAVTDFVINFSYVAVDGRSGKAKRSVVRDMWDETVVGDSFPAYIDGFGTVRAVAGIDPEFETLTD